MDWSNVFDNPIVLAVIVLIAAIAFPQLTPLIGPVLSRILKPGTPSTPVPVEPLPPLPAVPGGTSHPLLDILKKLIEQKAGDQGDDPTKAWDTFVTGQIGVIASAKKSTG